MRQACSDSSTAAPLECMERLKAHQAPRDPPSIPVTAINGPRQRPRNWPVTLEQSTACRSSSSDRRESTGQMTLRFLKLFKSVKSGVFRMIGSGEVLYQMIYVEDLVDGVLLCGTSEQAPGEVFILTGDRPHTLNTIAQTIAKTQGVELSSFRIPATPVYVAGALCELVCRPLGINPPLYRRRVDFFRKPRAFSIEKAQEVLGFSPKVDLADGLQRTATWYEGQGLL